MQPRTSSEEVKDKITKLKMEGPAVDALNTATQVAACWADAFVYNMNG